MAQTRMPRTVPGDYAGGEVRREVDDWLVEELHDGVAQYLWYLGVELSALNQEISPGEERLREHVKTLEGVAHEAYDQVRAILGQSLPADRAEEPLNAVVQREAQSFGERTGMEVRLTLDSVPFLVSPWHGHHVAAILREALCNAWRHGQTTWVQVDLKANGEKVSLSVTDGGSGFNPRVPRSGNYGMATMRKRAEALGGVVEVLSKVGKGTQVNLTFPVLVLQGQKQRKRYGNGRSHLASG